MPKTQTQLEYDKLKDAERSFLNSQRKEGKAKKKGRPTKDALILKALADDSTTFFKRILSDEMEEKLWYHFLDGQIMQRNEDGDPMRDSHGNILYREISGVSFNAFKQMVAYKRGMPAVKVDSNQPGSFTVNFNVMGASQKERQGQIRELGLLPVSTSDKV